MNEVAAMLAALQLGDSFFPSGGAAFSWGMETLCADRMIRNAADVESFVAGQLEQRWADFDRVAVLAAHAAANIEELCAMDREVDAATLGSEAREGARRVGTAMLQVHAQMGMDGAAAYKARIANGDAFGQMPIVQGFVARASGLDADTACAVSAHQFVQSLISAALRLGLLGHVAGQRILAGQRLRVATLMRLPCPRAFEPCAYVPGAEIAMMRHEVGSGRMFAS